MKTASSFFMTYIMLMLTWKKVLISFPLPVKVMRPVARSTRQPMTKSSWLKRAC